MSKKLLLDEVKRLNEKYFKKAPNELKVSEAYGGYEVHMRSKRTKDNKPYKASSLGYGESNVTYGHTSARETLGKLLINDSKGYIKDQSKTYRKKVYTRGDK